MLLWLAATITLHWTNPAFLPDTSCNLSLDLCHLTQVNIYRALVGGDGYPQLVRSHIYGTSVPPTDTIQVPDTPATWWVVPENNVGESQCERRGVTVGVPAVSVPWEPSPGDRLEYYDVRSRHLKGPPEEPGLYWIQVWREGKMVKVLRRVKLK